MMPDDLATAIRHAADAVPAQAPDLQQVLRRHRRRRLRSAVAAASVVVVAGALGVVLLGRAPAPQPALPGTSPTATTPPTPAAWSGQRLPLDTSWNVHDRDGKGDIAGYQPPAGLLELAPDRRIMSTPRPDVIDVQRQCIALDDGRTVLLGSKNLKPGTQRQDGIDATDLELRLVVLAPGGGVTLTRNVRVQGQDVQLIGATATDAYLYRTPGRIVRHNLATGHEDRLTALEPLPAWDIANLSVQQGLLLTSSAADCTLHVTAVPTGKPAGTVPSLPAGWQCPGAQRIRVSADGRSLAVPLAGQGPKPASAVALVDLASGRLTLTALEAGPASSGILGIAWSGTTARVAWIKLPDPPTTISPMTDVLQATDLPLNR